MGTTEDRSSDASAMASVKNADLKLEVVVLPVSDVDRAKAFYGGLGWRLDAEAARDALVARGAEVSEVFHPAAPGAQFHPDTSDHLDGRSPDSYGSFARFSDPDGNGWLLQEITDRKSTRLNSSHMSISYAV